MTVTRPTNPLDPITLSHPSGASATIYPHGATITSFTTATGKDILFCSSLAKKDGSKAIRGGVPLVFPQFGQPDKRMPQHGFLRVSLWTLGKDYIDESGDGAACCEFSLSLKDVVNARGGDWAEGETKFDCSAVLTVKLTAARLTATLTVSNTGAVPFNFQTLFHTYYKITSGKTALDTDTCYVTGLEGYSVEDKITNETYTQGDKPIIVDREVDRIYTNPSQPDMDVTVSTGEKLRVTATASVGGEKVPVGVVVWNPFIEKSKKMGDFADEEFKEMICVEPGAISDVPVLEAGKEAVLEQVINVL